MVLEGLVPALQAAVDGKSMLEHLVSVTALGGIKHVKLIDSTPNSTPFLFIIIIPFALYIFCLRRSGGHYLIFLF